MNWTKRIRAWLKDPFWVDRDWTDFAEMTDEELREEWNCLLDTDNKSNRFRRLCHFISLRWVMQAPERKTS